MSLKHYDSISKDFEENWFFSKSYFPTLAGLIAKSIKLESDNVFGDLGCGTGNYTAEIIKLSGCKLEQVVGVDFSQGMVDQFSERDICYSGVCSDLESFVGSTQATFDKLLLKEVVHHVKDNSSFYRKLNKILNPKGEFLIVTRPQKTNFPFFDKALEVFSENQISEANLLLEIKKSGFETKVEYVDIEISIAKEKLLRMIENRFMSTFNFFTDEELALGIKEVESKYSNLNEVTFLDSMIFIKGSK